MNNIPSVQLLKRLYSMLHKRFEENIIESMDP